MANKLELTWVGKEDKIDIEPRILIEKPELGYSYSQAKKHGQISIDEVSNADGIYDNMLIHGDNLLALKALEQEYAGKIKCIYIDPPYNTGSAFEHYDDNLEHSTWLSLMKPRLEILKNLLANDGIIFVQIDDNEQAYLRVIMDEVFGRSNFIANFIWIGRAGKGGTASKVANQHEYIHCYQKTDKAEVKQEQRTAVGGNYDDAVGKYKREQLRQWGQGDKREDRPSMWYAIKAPDGEDVFPIKEDGTDGRWRVGENTFFELLNENLIDIVRIDNAWKVYRKIRDGRTTESVYSTLLADLGTSATGTSEIKRIFGSKTFATPKPEKLISHLLMLATNPGDLVLDSFLGSGTTAAVAHKMGRRWIGIEMGEHAYTHCKVRLDKVVSGEDQGGISKAQNWKGGGGYKFYELAPSLILKDKYGREIINPVYNADMLAAAMAKQEGCVYCPSAECYWKQAKSTENAYLYTTTQHLTREYLDEIASDLKDDEHLIIACKSFEPSLERAYKNITIKKIPNILLDRCEFGKSDYKLNVVDLPVMDEEEDDE